jgi:ribosome-binding protein aMBF1 (putative translation factor)
MSDPANKTTLIVMAQAWLTLAEQAEKYGETTVVNQMPSPRSQSQQVAQQQQSQPDNPGKKQND